MKGMSTSNNIQSELQFLLAMYDKSQVRFDDPHLSAQLESLILEDELEADDDLESRSSLVRSTISLTMRASEKLEIDIRIPLGYPLTEKLSASCRLKDQSKNVQETKLNLKLESRLKNNAPNSGLVDLSLFELIEFCKGSLEQLEQSPDPERMEPKSSGAHVTSEDIEDQRLWIYSHHIYNKHKRKILVETADQLGLSGFSCPGKPGFVCVEGPEEACDEYWTRIRQLTWQKITVIAKQTGVENAFTNSSFKELRCDKSEFIKYLEAKGLSEVIKEYLGFS